MKLWPHQEFAISECSARIDAGERQLCVTTPTGGGKSVVIVELLRWARERGLSGILYTNRNLLVEQMMKVLRKYGIPFGVRAAEYADHQELDAPIQISSLQTEDARVLKSQKWPLHPANVVIVDEAHLQKGGVFREIIQKHRQTADAAVIGFTATPVGLANTYERLIVAGTVSQLRDCGALVPCHVFAPTEFDTSRIKPQKTGEFAYEDIKRAIWTPSIFGNVAQHWRRLNPDARPAILFAPGVAEATWFAQKFEDIGVRAASIDGEDVYVDGRTVASRRGAREEVLERFREGDIKILCNRFVLREGIDIPELYHCILATPIGSVQSYVQIVGRVLRAHSTTPEVILQDHGGNWWRHGSPNADRDWEGLWGVTDHNITKRREERLRRKEEPEPIVCPQCGAVRLKGPDCYRCGFRQTRKVRMVIQQDGTLKEMTGDIFRERKRTLKPDTEKAWERIYYRMFNSGRTFRQAEGLFAKENGYFPPHTLPLMPSSPLDWERKVREVPKDRLIVNEAAYSNMTR